MTAVIHPGQRYSYSSQAVRAILEADKADVARIRHQQLILGILKLTAQKQIGYGKKNDPFAGYNAAPVWGVDPWISCMLRASEKLQRLQAYNDRGNLENFTGDGESIWDIFDDVANLMLIARTLLEQQLGVVAERAALVYDQSSDDLLNIIKRVIVEAYHTDIELEPPLIRLKEEITNVK